MNMMNGGFIVLFVCFVLSLISIDAYRRTATELNIRKCKLTHTGIEYRGNVFTTKFKSLCRSWDWNNVTESDSAFADGSRLASKNYCRNPNGIRDDLWCYTYNPNSPIESCAVPLCNSKKCRVTGPGVEFGGDADATKSGYPCLSWSKVKTSFANSRFPDGSRAAAENRCRNPTGDPGGPWCYAAVDGTEQLDYCETPGCDHGDGGCDWTLVNGTDGDEPLPAHGHYTAIRSSAADNESIVHASFELKAWDPAAAHGDRPFRVSLTAYPIGVDDAFEVSVPPDAFVRSLTSAVPMELTWRNDVVVLTAGRPPKDVSTFEMEAPITPVTYVSFIGGGNLNATVAIRFPRCDRTLKCDEHVTNSQHIYRIFPLKKTITSSSELSFSVRAVISVAITYYTAPNKQTPRLVFVFAARPVQEVKIFYYESPISEEQLIFQKQYDIDIITYWDWHHYMITIVNKRLQINIIDENEKNPTTILDVSDYKLRFFHWFGIGSKTIAHWTLYCSGSENYPLSQAELPECVTSKSAIGYIGSQWVTVDGEPCVPWNVSSVQKLVKESHLIDGSYVKAKNYCRNPTKDPNGPYCFVAVESSFEKRLCHIQNCRNTKCKMTGVATDYLGMLNKTVSNRTCLKWSAAAKSNGRETLVFPDGSSNSKNNYCRNPTKEPTGAWCYVAGGGDDLCDVPDCTGGDSETLLLGGGGAVHWLYVLPEWRNAPGLRMALKRWTPGVYDGVSLLFRHAGNPPSGAAYDTLQVGADHDEMIKLYRSASTSGERGTRSADEELVYPHVMMTSRWTELHFEFVHDRPAASINVTMSSAVHGQIFRWTMAANDTDGRIAFVGLSTVGDGGQMGARLPARECLVHSSESETFSIFLPINVRTNTSLTNAKKEIVFRVKNSADGIIRVALLKRILSERYVLEIKDNRATLSYEGERGEQHGTFESKTGHIITADIWARISLSWNESVLKLDSDGGGWQWTVQQPLLIRYFSVANRGGRTAWTVNCDEQWRPPPDVDGAPRNGGWSEWGDWEECTKVCGGGTGERRRRCDNPRPNMSGKPCDGPSTIVGKCNQHECGQLSAKSLAKARRQLAVRPHNVSSVAGDRLTLSCDQPIVDDVRIESPDARFGWLHNGKPVSNSDGCTLVINSCTNQDSGVYAFVTQPPDSVRVVLKLFAVSVKDTSQLVYLKDTIWVRCNAVTLSYIFHGLSQEWIVNDSYVVKNYGVNTFASIDVDMITIENLHFQGVWKCVTTSSEINSSWVTNIMEIKVIGVYNMWTKIMNDPIIQLIFPKNSRPILIVSVCTILIFSLCAGTWGFATLINRWHKQLSQNNTKKKHEKIPYQKL